MGNLRGEAGGEGKCPSLGTEIERERKPDAFGVTGFGALLLSPRWMDGVLSRDMLVVGSY